MMPKDDEPTAILGGAKNGVFVMLKTWNRNCRYRLLSAWRRTSLNPNLAVGTYQEDLKRL
jgi:hypothetical protein